MVQDSWVGDPLPVSIFLFIFVFCSLLHPSLACQLPGMRLAVSPSVPRPLSFFSSHSPFLLSFFGVDAHQPPGGGIWVFV